MFCGIFRGKSKPNKMAIDELYLENLDEFINDGNKIVTYKWLSRTLGVHVNQAKQMLYAFVQHQRNNKDNDGLTVTYLLAGSTAVDDREASSRRVCIVPEEQLEATKMTMQPLTSCHIYSVQRTHLRDASALYAADYDLLCHDIFASNRFGAVKNVAASRRSEAELEKLRQGGAEAYAPSYQAKTTHKGSSKGKNMIGAMFSKAEKTEPSKPSLPKETPEEKRKETLKEAEPKEIKTVSKEAKKSPGGALASMFAKQATKPKPEVKSNEEKNDLKEKSGTTSKDTSQQKTTIKSGKSKRDADTHDEESSKNNKRRRIKVAVESSSSEDEIEIDEVPPTPPRQPSPEPEVISIEPDEKEDSKEVQSEKLLTCSDKTNERKVTSVENGHRRRKRKRKQVEHNYMDEDGFMVTEKVWESESTDATDEEEPRAKTAGAPASSEPKARGQPTIKDQPQQKAAKKKASPNKASGKQTSLMSFFKKK